MNWVADDLVCFFDRGQNAFYILFGRRSVSLPDRPNKPELVRDLRAREWRSGKLLATMLSSGSLRNTRLTRALPPSQMDRMMRRAFFLARTLTLLAILAAVWLRPSPSAAQVQIPAAALTDQTSLGEILQQGQDLEREHRWSDALTFYEGALRNHPDRRELEQRLAVARTHLDIARRYTDKSYLASLATLSESQALDLYAEVLLKIETYHVNNPHWGQLVYQGVVSLQIGPSEPAFVDQFPQPVSTGVSDAFLKDVRAKTDLNRIQDRHAAADAVAAIARLAVRDLGVNAQAAIMEFTCAAASSLDPYSSYLTGDQLDEVFSQIEGNFVGLGIELKADNDTLLIVNVIPGGPAEEAGIAANDRIVEVDGKSTHEISTDAAADMLKGPELSYVDVVLQSADGKSRRLHVQRRRVDVPSVQDIKLIDAANGVAYLKLTSFQKTTSRDVDNALWSLHRQGMRTLIMDLRGNPGGLLNASVEVADKFLTNGTIVSTRGRSAREDFDYQAHDVGTWRVPLIVLIDGDSASASEIFAGAMHDLRRATVVGQRSYGKGSVQGIFPLSRYKAGIRLTTAKFYSPSGLEISHHGVTPNVVVPSAKAHVAARPTESGGMISADGDATLAAALQVAHQSSNYQVRRTK
jgi:carboxyl-terminal processing protease